MTGSNVSETESKLLMTSRVRGQQSKHSSDNIDRFLQIYFQALQFPNVLEFRRLLSTTLRAIPNEAFAMSFQQLYKSTIVVKSVLWLMNITFKGYKKKIIYIFCLLYFYETRTFQTHSVFITFSFMIIFTTKSTFIFLFISLSTYMHIKLTFF